MLTSLVVFVVVSLLTRPVSEESAAAWEQRLSPPEGGEGV
jgi:hypothetical protein